jgi:hypothetical protein
MVKYYLGEFAGIVHNMERWNIGVKSDSGCTFTE